MQMKIRPSTWRALAAAIALGTLSWFVASGGVVSATAQPGAGRTR